MDKLQGERLLQRNYCSYCSKNYIQFIFFIVFILASPKKLSNSREWIYTKFIFVLVIPYTVSNEHTHIQTHSLIYTILVSTGFRINQRRQTIPIAGKT